MSSDKLSLSKGCIVRPKNGAGFPGRLIETPVPPKKWIVEYPDGRRKAFTKSFLKKYYEVTK